VPPGEAFEHLWVNLRAEAEERRVELQVALAALVEHGSELQGVDRADILKKARTGEVLVLDVRPSEEFSAAHLPHARSPPVDKLKKRLAEVPKDVPVVAYCRGPFCLMAKDAVELLRRKGDGAFHLTDGVAEWRARAARRFNCGVVRGKQTDVRAGAPRGRG
jgi:rhodanese-related sulfurtransferase